MPSCSSAAIFFFFSAGLVFLSSAAAAQQLALDAAAAQQLEKSLTDGSLEKALADNVRAKQASPDIEDIRHATAAYGTLQSGSAAQPKAFQGRPHKLIE